MRALRYGVSVCLVSFLVCASFHGRGDAAFQGSLPSPVTQAVNQGYLYGEVHVTDPNSGHTGIDFLAPNNTPVKAVAAGTVVQRTTLSGYGNVLAIESNHPLYPSTKIYQFFAHLSSYAVAVNDEVIAGQTVARSGNTGTDSYHLHFEVRVGSNSRLNIRNPEGFLARSTSAGYGAFYGTLKYTDGAWARKFKVRPSPTPLKPESGFGYAQTYWQFKNSGTPYLYPDQSAYGINFYTGKLYAKQYTFRFYTRGEVLKGQLIATVAANSEVNLGYCTVSY